MPLYNSKSKVYFFFHDIKFVLNNRNQLKHYVESILKKEKRRLDYINFIFCTDEALRLINRQYLQHDYYTDIITFDLSEQQNVQSEIYISIDRVRENAIDQGVSFKSELHRVIFHGVLHLCGYKDKRKVEKKEMREKEELYLNLYFN
jgi:probable rRNA maturation factor